MPITGITTPFGRIGDGTYEYGLGVNTVVGEAGAGYDRDDRRVGGHAVVAPPVIGHAGVGAWAGQDGFEGGAQVKTPVGGATVGGGFGPSGAGVGAGAGVGVGGAGAGAGAGVHVGEHGLTAGYAGGVHLPPGRPGASYDAGYNDR